MARVRKLDAPKVLTPPEHITARVKEGGYARQARALLETR